MIKAEDGILYGQRIFKNKDYSIEKGDIDWQEDIKYDDIIIEFRVFLEDITGWEEWKGVDADPRYKYKGPLTSIELADSSKPIALFNLTIQT